MSQQEGAEVTGEDPNQTPGEGNGHEESQPEERIEGRDIGDYDAAYADTMKEESK